MRVLRRIPGERFSEVTFAWVGCAVVVLGGGPSLTLAQVQQVGEAHAAGQVKCIAVNDAYLIAPWADLHYAADSHWHKWHTAGIDKPVLKLKAEQVRERWASFAGQKCTIQNSGANVADLAVHMLRNKHGVRTFGYGLSFDPRSLVTGRSSGFQAINLSTLAGSRLIMLLGFDSREGQPMSHWHGGHPRPMPENAYDAFRRGFTAAQHDLQAIQARVINCSPGTAITAFEKMPLWDALALLKEPA